MTSSKPLRADAQRNRDALVAAARRAFDRGDHAIRFDDFAALAGVGTGTLYRHFPTREALAEAVYREEVTALVDRAAALLTQVPPGKALAAFLHEMVDHMVAHQGLARTLATLMTPRATTLIEGGCELEAAVAELLRAAIEARAVRDDASVGAIMLVLHGIGTGYRRAQWKTEAGNAITLVIEGLRRPNSP